MKWLKLLLYHISNTQLSILVIPKSQDLDTTNPKIRDWLKRLRSQEIQDLRSQTLVAAIVRRNGNNSTGNPRGVALLKYLGRLGNVKMGWWRDQRSKAKHEAL